MMRILLATDGSEDAARARALLASLPLGSDTFLRVLTTVPDATHFPGPQPEGIRSVWELFEGIGREAEPVARRLAEREAEPLRAHGRSTETEVRHGDPATQIVEAARKWDADLIALGSRGLTALEALALGSVSRAVAHAASCPVLVARGPRLSIQRVLLATDASAGAEAAVSFLARLPLPEEAELHVVHAVKPYRPFLGLFPAPRADLERAVREARSMLRQSARLLTEGTVRFLAASGKRAQSVVLDGDPAGQILRYAEEHDVDLITVGRRGQRALRGFFVGSVADRVLKDAPCPVLIVPPEETV